ncbi:alkaline-phosphatase-like protein [Hyaloraphidium curvatum]|nr:alkaline-phosphatase-like protein [Hyaloraphidium curvatum]
MMIKAISFAAVAALCLACSPVEAQKKPLPGQFNRYRAAPRYGFLSIVPPDGAEFLKGQYFDIRVELHNECATNSSGVCGSPSLSGLKCQVEGQDLPAYFGKSWPAVADTWNYTYFKDMNASFANLKTPVGVSSYVWRSNKFDSTGSFAYRCEIPGVFTGGRRDLSTPQVVFGRWNVRSFANQGRLAKKVAFFIGDGMSPAMITAARAISEPTWYGKHFQNLLNLEKDMTMGKVMTNGMDSMLTDSANSAASYNCGHKGFVNTLNVNADTSPDTLDDPKVETLAEYLRRVRPNTCIGVVTTAEIQDATPAAVWAHTRRRSDKAVITAQNLEQTFKDWVPPPVQADVILGGGGEFFCNTSSTCKPLKGRDMYQEYQAKGYKLVTTTPELQGVSTNQKLLGIFTFNNLDTWIDRVLLTDNLGRTNSSPFGLPQTNYQQAGLELMVAKAIEVMDKRCSDGWYLMAEAASVDKSMHPQDYQRGLADLLEMDRAIKYVKDYAKNGDTLIMVTADHGQAYDVFGSVDTAYLASLPDEDSPEAQAVGGSQFLKKQAIGVYDTAGFFDLVVDPQTGATVNWDGRFVLAGGKVDGPERSENFTLVRSPESGTNPLTRLPAVSNKNLSSILGYTAYTENPKDGIHGAGQSGLLPGTQGQSVHSMIDVALYCYGPGQGVCSRTVDNTELFFMMAQAFGL